VSTVIFNRSFKAGSGADGYSIEQLTSISAKLVEVRLSHSPVSS
jgi:hypothetical protein